MNKFTMLTCFAACVLATGLTGCATGGGAVSPSFYERRPDRIAIVDVGGDIRGRVPKNQVEDFFTMELFRKGYGVVERSRVDRLLEEQDFQRSEVTTADEAAEIGRILNIPAVAMLDVTVDGDKISMTGRIVSPETGEVQWVGSGRGGRGGFFATVFGAILGGAAGSQVGGGSGRTAATIAGGVLGGAAGHELTPQTARIVERAIRQMVDDLPERGPSR